MHLCELARALVVAAVVCLLPRVSSLFYAIRYLRPALVHSVCCMNVRILVKFAKRICVEISHRIRRARLRCLQIEQSQPVYGKIREFPVHFHRSPDGDLDGSGRRFFKRSRDDESAGPTKAILGDLSSAIIKLQCTRRVQAEAARSSRDCNKRDALFFGVDPLQAGRQAGRSPAAIFTPLAERYKATVFLSRN